MAVIQRIVASGGSQASFDFTSIPGTYESLVLEINGRGDDAATDLDAVMRMNNDSAANYSSYRDISNTGGDSRADSIGGTSCLIGRINGDGSPSNDASHLTITIPGYARTVFNKDYDSDGFLDGLGGGGQHGPTRAGGRWLSTAAITRLTAFPGAGNWKDGTVATLYGIS